MKCGPPVKSPGTAQATGVYGPLILQRHLHFPKRGYNKVRGTLQDQWRDDGPAFGTIVGTCDCVAVKERLPQGGDFVVVDLQHGAARLGRPGKPHYGYSTGRFRPSTRALEQSRRHHASS